MAGGYLGKISAVISANTGDYVRKLGESAKETRAFAATVSQTLNRASSEAAKSLQSIYTPLQQFERALRAAASEKLSFKGFDGAIRTVDELKRRIDVLRGSDLEVAFRVTGMKSVQEIKSALNSISQKDLDLFGNIGGFAGITKALADLDAVQEKADSIAVKPKVSREQLLDLQQKLSVLDDKTIGILINITNKRELDDAVTSARQMRDVLQDVTQPLTRVTQGFTQLGGEAQAAFIPALAAAQREAEKLALSFSPERYAAATRSVASLAATVGQLTEAQRLASQVPTGRELAFSDPRLNANLRAAAGAGQQAAALPASAIAGDPEFSGLTSQLNRVSELAVAAAARLKALRETGAPGQSQAAAEFDRLNGVLEQLTSRLNQKFQVRLDAEKAIADAQKLDQAISQFRLEIASGSLNVLQNESRAISQTGESLAAYESRLQAASDARMRASATGQMFLNVLQRESQALSGSGEADLAAYEARLRSQADARMRASAAGEMFLNVLQRESDLLSTAGSIGQTNIPLPPGFGGSPDAGLGADIADSQRQLEALRGSLTSIKSQFDSLPSGLRAQLVPAIQEAEANFRRLASAGVSATAAEIENAANEVDRLNAALRRATQSAALLSFGDFMNNANVRQATGELNALQQILVNIEARAGGPAAQAYERYRQRLQEAINTGTTGLPRVRRELEALQVEAAEAAAATGRISFGAAMRGIRRGGDVARGGVDNVSLAIQQAGFAIDDFMSSTGGFDQKLRAISNNITQLAFILGGTTGLFVGLGAVLAGQVAVGILKWINNGRTAEDQTKALNDALSRQKSILDELAQAYQKVADSIRDSGLSDSGRREATFRRQIGDIQQRQEQARNERILSLDTNVGTARADVARAERQVNEASSPAQRARAQIDLNAARERQRAVERRALEQSSSPLGDIRQQVIDAISGQLNEDTRRAAAGARAAATAGGGAAAAQAADLAARRTAERNAARITALQGIGQRPDDVISAIDGRIQELVQSGASADIILPLQQLRERIVVYTKQLEADNFATRISRSALRIAEAMDASVADIEAAFSGINGASSIEDEIASFAESLAQLQEAAARAATAGRPEEARALEEDVNMLREHINALRDAAAAVRVFGESLGKLSQSVASDVSSLEQRAEDARRNDVRFGTPETAERRRQAEEDVRRARRTQQRFEDARANAIEQIEQNAVRNGDQRFRRIREIDQMLAAPMGGTGADGVRGGTAQERAAAREERAMLRADIEREAATNPAVQAAQRAADTSAREAAVAAGADRGRQIGMTDAQRAIEQTQAQLADVRDRAGQMFQPGQANQDVADFLLRSRDELGRGVAPAIFSMADQVMNAALQGPSRAALTAADVGTSQGAAELNRLLRGDDPNRNANIVELQKQNTTLTAINQGIQQMADSMGIVLDFR